MKNILLILLMAFASLHCAANIEEPDSAETGAILIDFKENIMITERIDLKDSFRFNADVFSFAITHDTTYLEITKTDTHLWKIIIFKDWNQEIINQALGIDPEIKLIKQVKDPENPVSLSLKCLDSPLVVKYDSVYQKSFIGADFQVLLPGDTSYLAKSDFKFFSSSPYENESYKIRLFDDKYLIWGQIIGLLSEFKSVEERYINHSHFFWAITK